MGVDTSKKLAEFLGDDNFPVEWKNEEEKGLLWIFDDNHCPNPISPMYFSLHGWWGPTCEYLFRRFNIDSGVAWHGKVVNGYVYTAIEPRDAKEVKAAQDYYFWVLPAYATNFLNWWETRYLPEVFRNFEYLDNFDTEKASIQELMIYLEEAIDIQERHFRLHWILNWAQFQAAMGFGGTVAEILGDVNPDMMGKVNVSRKDRNWDSLKALWELKEVVKADAKLKTVFEGSDTAADVLASLNKDSKGQDFLAKVKVYASEFGYKAIYTHEYTGVLYVEDNSPILEEIKSYLASDFDYNTVYDKCCKEQDEAIQYLREKLIDKSDEDKKKFVEALDLNLRMLPLTPDHHFYFDQGTYARVRLVLLSIGRKLQKMGMLDSADDIMYLDYDQLRAYVGNPDGFDGKGLVKKAYEARDKALTVTPKSWVGTVTQWNMYEEPYHTLWGYPEKFEREQAASEVKGTIEGVAASPGVVEGIARVVKSSDEFNSVQQGEIIVCIMTNPAWVVVFSKIIGIITNAGGALSHSAVVAREFMIPAVVGTSNATELIKNGDRVRVDGDNGVVTIL